MGEADLGALHLAIARLATKVSGDFVDVRDAGRADRMTFGDQAARHIDRRAAVAERCTGVDEVTGPSGLTQPEIVVVDQLGGGEAVVELDEVEIVGSNARLLIGLRCGVAGERVDVGLDLRRRRPRVRRCLLYTSPSPRDAHESRMPSSA